MNLSKIKILFFIVIRNRCRNLLPHDFYYLFYKIDMLLTIFVTILLCLFVTPGTNHSFVLITTEYSIKQQITSRTVDHLLKMTSSGGGGVGSGLLRQIEVIYQPDDTFLQKKGIDDWGTWGCGISKFPWTYSENESCYLLSGKVTVTPTDTSKFGNAVTFSKGDFVTFPAGMSCTWDVTEKIQKHYIFF